MQPPFPQPIFLSRISGRSIGVQSFDDSILKASGRAHCVQDATDALIDIHKSDFQTFSVDLISSLPHSTHATWTKTLEQAIHSQPTHISVYDLQVEEKTAFGRWYTPGQFPLPSEEDSALMYSTAVEMLTQSGFEHLKFLTTQNLVIVVGTTKSIGIARQLWLSVWVQRLT